MVVHATFEWWWRPAAGGAARKKMMRDESSSRQPPRHPAPTAAVPPGIIFLAQFYLSTGFLSLLRVLVFLTSGFLNTEPGVYTRK